MYDPKAPSSELALAEYLKPEIADRLLKYALWRTRSLADAKDLVADAFIRVCDPDDRPWDPARGSFFRHIRMVMGDDFREEARWGFKAREVVDTEHEVFDRVVDPIPQPDAALQHKRKFEWMRGMMTTVLERLRDKDSLVLGIWDLACEGRHDEPDDFAEALGVSRPEVYEALRRLRYHAAKVREAWEEEELERMAPLREGAERARERRNRW